MNKGYIVPIILIVVFIALAGLVLFGPFTQTAIPNVQPEPINQNTVEPIIETQLNQVEEELPPIILDETQGETTTTQEFEGSSLKIPAGIPTPECAQDPNCANRLGCTTDPKTGMTVCY